jgi:molybdopterin/thiamine biosynthesis adenylyltransferase
MMTMDDEKSGGRIKAKTLTAEERELYSRQIPVPRWGLQGQRRLKNSVAFVAGAGGLGSAVCFYLAAAGIGGIRLCDSEAVDLSNLNRQILFRRDDIGKLKAETAAQRLSQLNPRVQVIPLCEIITQRSIQRLAGGSSILVDCLDNFETRYILNTYSVARSVPLAHAGVQGFSGQLSFFHPPKTACLRCVFPDVPPRQKTAVIGATAGILGSMEAGEVLKYLTNRGGLLENRLLIWDGERGAAEMVAVSKDPSCPVCGG